MDTMNSPTAKYINTESSSITQLSTDDTLTPTRKQQCCQWLYDFWAELLVLAILILSFFVNPKLGVMVLSVEVAFDLTLAVVVLLRYFKKCLPLWGPLFLLNRSLGLAFPILGLIYLSTSPTTLTTPELINMVFFGIDLIVVVVTFNRIARWFVPMHGRTATVEDIPALLAIEASAFELPEHRASEETIRRRLLTSPETIHVCDHMLYGVVRSVYMKPVASQAIETETVSWPALNNNGDFKADSVCNSWYVIGLQGVRTVRQGTDVMSLYTVQQALEHNIQYIYGGLRVPGFAAATEFHTVDTYLNAKQDKLVNRMTKGSFCRPQIQLIKGVEDYWYDPASRSCAALIRMQIPGYAYPRWIKSFIKSCFRTVETLLSFTRFA